MKFTPWWTERKETWVQGMVFHQGWTDHAYRYGCLCNGVDISATSRTSEAICTSGITLSFFTSRLNSIPMHHKFELRRPLKIEFAVTIPRTKFHWPFASLFHLVEQHHGPKLCLRQFETNWWCLHQLCHKIRPISLGNLPRSSVTRCPWIGITHRHAQ